MSPESEPLRRVPPPADDLDADREVDFGRYARRIAGKWWLLLIGLLIGGALGYLYGQTGGSTYQAQATIFLGQPLSLELTPIQALSSDPSGVAAIARSQAVVNEVSDQVGIPARKLRRNISASVLGERNRQTTNVALIGVTVRGTDPDKAEQAANLLAEKVITSTSTYADAKIETLQERLDAQQAQLDAVDARIDDVSSRIEQAEGSSPTDQLLLANLLETLQAQRADLTERMFTTQEFLEAAQEVERGKVVTPAAASKVDARSGRTSTVVGAFIGLILAALAALLWPSRSRAKPA